MRKTRFLLPAILLVAGLALTGCFRSKQPLFDASSAVTPFTGKVLSARQDKRGFLSLNSRGKIRGAVYDVEGKSYVDKRKKQSFTLHKFPGRTNFYILQLIQKRGTEPRVYYLVAFIRGNTVYSLASTGGKSMQRKLKAAGIAFTAQKSNVFFASSADVIKAYDMVIKARSSRSRRLNWTRYLVAVSSDDRALMKAMYDKERARWQKSKMAWAKGEPE